MVECNKVLTTNYCRYIIDVDIKAYFETNKSILDKIDYSRLSSMRKSHRKIFAEGIEQITIDHNLDILILELDKKEATQEELEVLD